MQAIDKVFFVLFLRTAVRLKRQADYFVHVLAAAFLSFLLVWLFEFLQLRKRNFLCLFFSVAFELIAELVNVIQDLLSRGNLRLNAH
jgi:hypothetical protein